MTKIVKQTIKFSFVCTLLGENNWFYKSYVFPLFFSHFSLWCIDHERIGRKSCSKNKIIKNALTRIWTGDLLFTSQASYHWRLICVFWNKRRQSILNNYAVITCTLESSQWRMDDFPSQNTCYMYIHCWCYHILLRFICSKLREGNPVSIQMGLSAVI